MGKFLREILQQGNRPNWNYTGKEENRRSSPVTYSTPYETSPKGIITPETVLVEEGENGCFGLKKMVRPLTRARYRSDEEGGGS